MEPQKNNWKSAQGALYSSLFIFLGVSIIFLLLKLTDTVEEAWDTYFRIYLIFALAHTWYIFTLLFLNDLRRRKYKPYAGEKIAVIVPVFNEDPALLETSLKSLIAAEGNKDIFVIDDGSSDEKVQEVLKRYIDQYGVRVYYFDKNKGKRQVLHSAITSLVTTHQYVVTLDSDTVLLSDSLVRLVEPLQRQKIGAVTGDVRLLNEGDNWLTKMTGAYYWAALHIHRAAQSSLGMVSCCSGALASYKSEVIKSIIDEFIEEEFLGEKCTYSDDRHLTNLVLKAGYDVVFRPEAVGYTYSPRTYAKFIRQQLRWKRGFIQEALYCLTYSFKVKPLLFFEVLLFELFLPLVSAGIILLVVLNSFFDPAFFFFGVIPSLFVLLVITHLPLIVYAPKKILGLIYYTFFSHFVMYWIGLYALFTMKKKSWITR